jgi:hypothetical protein
MNRPPPPRDAQGPPPQGPDGFDGPGDGTEPRRRPPPRDNPQGEGFPPPP